MTTKEKKSQDEELKTQYFNPEVGPVEASSFEEAQQLIEDAKKEKVGDASDS